jgi:hypothetical protein
MKTSDLLWEARAKPTGLVGLLMDADRELGLNHKWQVKHRISDEVIKNGVAMMNDGKKADSMGQLTSPLYPLNKVLDGFKKLSGSQLFDIHSGLRQLIGLSGFVSREENEKMRDAAVTLANRQHEMTLYTAALLNVMQCMMNILTVAHRSDDEYRKSMATAIVKKLGLDV